MGVNTPAFHSNACPDGMSGSSLSSTFRSNLAQQYPPHSLFPSSSKKTISKILLLTISYQLLAISFVFAQQVNLQPIKISGKFISDSEKIALPGVVIVLYTPDSAKQFATSTDNNGNFVFENLAPSRYRLRATFLGYAGFNIRLRRITRDKSDSRQTNV